MIGSRKEYQETIIFEFVLFLFIPDKLFLTLYLWRMETQKICDLKKFFLPSSAWFMKTNIINPHINWLFYIILFDIIRLVLVFIFSPKADPSSAGDSVML